MGRVIILEGPDGSGKTMIAKYLMSQGFEYKHEGPPPLGIDLIDYYHEKLQESISGESNVVHDRLWLGERIYGPVVRGIDRVSLAGQTLFQRLMISKPVLQYVCIPPFDIARDNYLEKIKDKGDFLQSIEKWEETFGKYCNWCAEYSGTDAVFDYTSDDPRNLLVAINSPFLNDNCLPHGVIGSKKATYLFIGDMSNHSYLDSPFFNVTNSSGYFNEALRLVGIRESSLAITNAFKRNGEPNLLRPILDSLPYLEVIILLGSKAHDWFYKQAIGGTVKILKLPHPAFLRRFKGSDPLLLATMIKEALSGSPRV